jgi:type I restriction enzyme S subunit
MDLRLDAEYYIPEHLLMVEKLISTGCCVRLRDLEVNGSYGILPDSDEYGAGTLPLLRGQDLQGSSLINIPIDAPRVPDSYYKNARARINPGEILLLIKGATIGAPQSVSIVPEMSELKAIVNGSIYKFGVKSPNDPYYICAFMGSDIGCQQKIRAIANTGIFYNDQEEIRKFYIPLPNAEIQKAIGNKLRKAERLRELALVAKQQIDEVLNRELVWEDAEKKIPKLCLWINSFELDNRLDGKYNSPQRFWVLKHLKSNNIRYKRAGEVFDISAMIGWKGLTTEHYVEDGPYMVRGVDIDNGVLSTRNMVKVDIDKYHEQPQIHLKYGDLVLTKDGTIGKAAAVPKIDAKICAGSTVARLRIKSDLPPYYLESIINHRIIQIQIESFATGLAQPHITQEWIVELLIPIIDSFQEIDDLTKKHHFYMTEIKKYTSEVKTDIGTLIDGKINTGELFDASREIELWLVANPSPLTYRGNS